MKNNNLQTTTLWETGAQFEAAQVSCLVCTFIRLRSCSLCCLVCCNSCKVLNTLFVTLVLKSLDSFRISYMKWGVSFHPDITVLVDWASTTSFLPSWHGCLLFLVFLPIWNFRTVMKYFYSVPLAVLCHILWAFWKACWSYIHSHLQWLAHMHTYAQSDNFTMFFRTLVFYTPAYE